MFISLPFPVLKVIVGLFFIGVLFFVIALVCCMREFSALKAVQSRCAPSIDPKTGTPSARHQPLSISGARDLLDVGNIKESIIGARLKDILTILDNSPESLSSLHLQDLHRMSSHAMHSSVTATILRWVCNVLLICGICGTLWGVHEALSGSNIHNMTILFEKLPNALEPSKYAVLFTVVLLGLRLIIEICQARLLYALDSFTLTTLFPDLMPSGDWGQQMNDFAEQLSIFSQSVQTYVNAGNAIKDMVDNFYNKSDSYFQLGESLRDSLDKMKEGEVMMQTARQSIGDMLHRTTDAVDGLHASVEKMEQERDNMQKSTASLREHLSSFEKDAQQVTATRQLMLTLTSQVKGISGALQTMETVRDDATALRLQLQEASAKVEQESASTAVAVERLQGHVSTIRQDIDVLQTTASALAGQVSLMEKNLDGRAQTTQAFNDGVSELSLAAESLHHTTEEVQRETAKALKHSGSSISARRLPRR